MKNNNKDSVIPIFFAIDNNYVPFLAVALESIQANCSKDYQYEIYILNNGINDEYMEMIKQYEKDNYHINYVDLEKRLKTLKLHVRDYYTTTIYFRLFIADIFPEYDKALYLDADIIVKGDIAELYNFQLEDNLVGAIADDVVSACDEFKNYTMNVLGVPFDQYFNSGILVMNLKKFREDHVFDQFIDLLNKFIFDIAPDQDYLNVICHNHVKYIPAIWNTAPLPNRTYDEENIKLIHYKLTAKPWHYKDIPLSQYFWQYAKKTPFYLQIIDILNNYSLDNIRNDALTEVNLKRKAQEEADLDNTYYQVISRKGK